ncbi:MAG: DUF4339 domain-containing protein [Planctomycetia bacterium]|nr:DUF4339 domain-containing protein [Planctomycetia bacterium]
MGMSVMVAEWFILSNDHPTGPYTQEALLGFMQQGNVVPGSFVRRLDGPWMTGAQAYAQISAAMAQMAAAQQPAPTAYGAPRAPSNQSVASTFAARNRQRKWSSIFSMIISVCSILVGCAGAVYIYKNFGSLLIRPPAQQKPQEIIVIQQPPKVQATGTAEPTTVPSGTVPSSTAPSGTAPAGAQN